METETTKCDHYIAFASLREIMISIMYNHKTLITFLANIIIAVVYNAHLIFY